MLKCRAVSCMPSHSLAFSLVSSHSSFAQSAPFQPLWPQIRAIIDLGGCKGIQSRFGRAYIAIGEPHSLSLAGDDANGA